MMTVQYYDVSRLIADPLSDPLCQMLAEEGDADEIDAIISQELAWTHVKPRMEVDDD